MDVPSDFCIRSEEKLDTQLRRLFSCCKMGKARPVMKVCFEQSFFLVDSSFFASRSDLKTLGRAVFGSLPPKVAPLKVEKFLHDLQKSVSEKGLISRTAQMAGEGTSLFVIPPLEDSLSAIRTDSVLKEWIEKIASKEGLTALFDPQPFPAVAKSVQKIQWSLETERGRSLNGIENSILWAALLHAFHGHIEHVPSGAIDLEEYNQGVIPPDFFLTVFHANLADSLSLILDEVADGVDISEHPKRSTPRVWGDAKMIRAFQGILTAQELDYFQETFLQRRCLAWQKQAHVMVEIFRTQILPASLVDQKNRAETLSALQKVDVQAGSHQMGSLQTFAALIDQAVQAIDEVEKTQRQMQDLGWEAQEKVFLEILEPKLKWAKQKVDHLEERIDATLWPL